MLSRHSVRLLAFSISSLFLTQALRAQTINYFGSSGTLNGTTWSTNPAGPYTSLFNATGGGIATFNNAATATGASITVAGIDVGANLTLSPVGGTISNQGNAVIPINVAAGVTADFGTQSWTNSATAGYIKNGDGVLALAGNTYGGGFTLNAGTVILRGINAMGGGATNSLTLNGGIVAGSATRDLTGKYPNGISIGGNVQFGDTTGLASSSANLIFSNTMSLGSGNRTLTLGNAGVVTLGGVITNSTSTGITFAATANGTGRFEITNVSNTYTGTTSIIGGEARFTADGSFGAVPSSVTADSIVIDGGRLATGLASFTLNANRGIQVGSSNGTAISPSGSFTLTYNGVISDLPSTTGNLTKQGSGTLVLGGASTFSGSTNINQGILRLNGGDNRLPTTTILNLGQPSGSNLGTLDLNGFNQFVAGLNSVAGTSNSGNNNTITSSTPATLTINNSTDNFFGDGANANSGVITGAVSLVKSGAGKLTLEDSNTYTGTTTVNGGILRINGQHTGGGAYTINPGGTLQGTGGIVAPVNIAGGTLAPGNNQGVLTINGAVTFSSTSTFAVELNGNTPSGTGYDQLSIGNTGSISLNNANLFVTLGFAPSVNDIFFIIENRPGVAFTSFFNNLPEGASIAIGNYVGNITYLANFSSTPPSITGGFDVAIYNLALSVPEPGSIALMGLVGFGAVQWYLRMQKKQPVIAAEEGSGERAETLLTESVE